MQFVQCSGGGVPWVPDSFKHFNLSLAPKVNVANIFWAIGILSDLNFLTISTRNDCS